VARDFDTAIERFEAAEKLVVHSIEVKYSALEDFRQALRRLDNTKETDGVSDKHSNLIERAQSALNELRKSPLAPSEQVLGLGEIASEIKSLGLHEYEQWAAILKAIETLMSDEHPVSDVCGLLKKCGLSDLIAGDRLSIVTKSKHPETLRRYLKVRDSDYDLINSRQLKNDGFWDVAILLGTQQRPYLHFETKEDAAREVSWIFFAPPAHKLVVITWSTGQKFNLADCVIRSELKPPKVEIHASSQEIIWPPDRTPPRLPPPPPPPPRADTPCRQLSIMAQEAQDKNPETYVVAFAKSIPPAAWVLTQDDYEFSIVTVPDPAMIKEGSVLLLREDFDNDEYDPQRDRVRKIAESLANNNYADLRNISDQFKRELARASSEPGSAQKLREVGIVDPDYYLRVHKSPHYIGPISAERHRMICLALSIPYLEQDYSALKEVRRLHVQAGNEMLRLIEKHLVSVKWASELDENHFFEDEGNQFGRILLAKVLRNAESKCIVSELGQKRRAVDMT
jgi:hypothetical protein